MAVWVGKKSWPTKMEVVVIFLSGEGKERGKRPRGRASKGGEGSSAPPPPSFLPPPSPPPPARAWHHAPRWEGRQLGRRHLAMRERAEFCDVCGGGGSVPRPSKEFVVFVSATSGEKEKSTPRARSSLFSSFPGADRNSWNLCDDPERRAAVAAGDDDDDDGLARARAGRTSEKEEEEDG